MDAVAAAGVPDAALARQHMSLSDGRCTLGGNLILDRLGHALLGNMEIECVFVGAMTYDDDVVVGGIAEAAVVQIMAIVDVDNFPCFRRHHRIGRDPEIDLAQTVAAIILRHKTLFPNWPGQVIAGDGNCAVGTAIVHAAGHERANLWRRQIRR